MKVDITKPIEGFNGNSETLDCEFLGIMDIFEDVDDIKFVVVTLLGGNGKRLVRCDTNTGECFSSKGTKLGLNISNKRKTVYISTVTSYNPHTEKFTQSTFRGKTFEAANGQGEIHKTHLINTYGLTKGNSRFLELETKVYHAD